MTDSILLPALGVVALCATLIVVISTALYVRLNRKYLLLAEENTRLKNSAEVEAQKILDAAHLHASEVIKNAQAQAQKVLTEATSFDQSLRKHALTVTSDVIARENTAVEQVIHDVKKTGEAAIAAANQQMTREVAVDLSQFKTGLEGEFKKEYQAVAAELAKYKESQESEIRKKVQEVMDRVLTKALASSLTAQDQEELVKKALLSISHEYEA